MTRFENIYYTICHYIWKLTPKYRNVAFYRPLFWKMIFDRITKGYDTSVTWSLDYYTAKWLYPRLLLFYDKVRKNRVCPCKYESIIAKEYIDEGYVYLTHKGRFADLNVEKAVHLQASEMFLEDIWAMAEAFRDILEEEDHWERWYNNWKHDVEKAQHAYNYLKTNKKRKEYWESYGFRREWYPSIQFHQEDFAQRKRDKGLALFAEHFQELWW